MLFERILLKFTLCIGCYTVIIMSDVQFEEQGDNLHYRRTSMVAAQDPLIVRLAMQAGWKEKSTVYYLLGCISVLFIITAFFIFYFSRPRSLSEEEILQTIPQEVLDQQEYNHPDKNLYPNENI